uniref:Uncharacterized protein n=1 Tax=Glossina brevipalpis TaxID=37001 RepID=A0A1A9W905_9MUSC
MKNVGKSSNSTGNATPIENTRKISRFCVSRVQEQKAAEQNKTTVANASGVNVLPKPSIDLQGSAAVVAQSTGGSDKTSLVNTPTEQKTTPSQYHVSPVPNIQANPTTIGQQSNQPQQMVCQQSLSAKLTPQGAQQQQQIVLMQMKGSPAQGHAVIANAQIQTQTPNVQSQLLNAQAQQQVLFNSMSYVSTSGTTTQQQQHPNINAAGTTIQHQGMPSTYVNAQQQQQQQQEPTDTTVTISTPGEGPVAIHQLA